MSSIIVLGTQWGDEGKGKIVDLLTPQADIIIRYQGGNNAGHTVIIGEEKYVLHVIPSGILREKKCLIGNGVVLDLNALISEMDMLKTKGIDAKKYLQISGKAHLIMPYHKAIDKENEAKKGVHKIGTTGRGIGPSYSDKAARVGVRMADLNDKDLFREKLSVNIKEINFFLDRLYGQPGYDLDTVIDEFSKYADELGDLIVDDSLELDNAITRGENLLFEGAQGTLLDIDHGTYPFVTSSSSSAGGACTGTGVGPTKIDEVIGIVKAYTTRVGSGPFPTELTDSVGEHLATVGGEIGATTGRPRRCGWIDAIGLRYAKRINSLSSLVLTKIDVLDGLDEIKMCVGYKYKGEIFKEMPMQERMLGKVEPVYKTYKGWKQKNHNVRNYDELSQEAKDYIKIIEDNVDCPVSIISTGPDRNDSIILKYPFPEKA